MSEPFGGFGGMKPKKTQKPFTFGDTGLLKHSGGAAED
jgi:hypothetical protein